MPVEVDRAVKNPVSDLYSTNNKDDFRLDEQPRRRLLSVLKRTTCGLPLPWGVPSSVTRRWLSEDFVSWGVTP